MSFDLKPYLDAVTEAQDAATAVAGRIDAFMHVEGTDEERAQALADAQALLPELDEAEAQVESAENLYEAMVRVTTRNSVANKLVPAGEVDPTLEGKETKNDKVMNRAAFDDLDLADRQKFIIEGGIVKDEV